MRFQVGGAERIESIDREASFPGGVLFEHIDDLGGPRLYNHYPWGWAQAGNTPFRWYKQFTHAGGITNGLLLRWPAGGVPAGEIRRQYHHVIDVTPTILDLVGVPAPTQVRGVTQQPMHGISMSYTFTDPHAESRRHTQHYEMWGNRGLWHDGWMAEAGIGLLDHVAQGRRLDLAVDEGRDHRLGHLPIRFACKGSDLGVGQNRPMLRHIEAAVAGKAGEEGIAKAEDGSFAPRGDIVHGSILSVPEAPPMPAAPSRNTVFIL